MWTVQTYLERSLVAKTSSDSIIAIYNKIWTFIFKSSTDYLRKTLSQLWSSNYKRWRLWPYDLQQMQLWILLDLFDELLRRFALTSEFGVSMWDALRSLLYSHFLLHSNFMDKVCSSFWLVYERGKRAWQTKQRRITNEKRKLYHYFDFAAFF